MRHDDDVDSLEQSFGVLPPALLERSVKRFKAGQWAESEPDSVSNEIPVALVFNGISHVVMMATPQNLKALALGFALSEGVLESPDECYGIEVVPIDANIATQGLTDACEVRLEISSRRFAGLKQNRRSMSGRTGCGVCGVESLAAFELNTPQVQRPDWIDQVDPVKMIEVFDHLPQTQTLNMQTGSVHAAGWVTPEGVLIKTMEDVGRHNALDKLLGWRAGAGRHEAKDGFVVMTSRASYELIRKCAFLNVPILATISAPTALAITMATEAKVRLYGLCRKQQIVQYTD
ncbi:MAG: formate dehydrogenase accessory sulfurtransferase FdhD [Saezia sp.]